MERTELIEAIRKVCEIQNDIRIDMRVRGEGWFFDAAVHFSWRKRSVCDGCIIYNKDRRTGHKVFEQDISKDYSKIDFPHE